MICFIGSPACGKGSQSSVLKRKYNCSIFSFGEYLRKEISRKSDFGLKIKRKIENGEILSVDEIFFNLDLSIFKQEKLILDGFPRTLEQSKFFIDFCSSNKLVLDYIIEFQVKDEILIDRMNNRVICSECLQTYSKKDLFCKCGSSVTEIRQDDNLDVFIKRLKEYKMHRVNIKKFYDKVDFYKIINADESLAEVTKKIEKELGSWLI